MTGQFKKGLLPSPPSSKDYSAEQLLGAAGPVPDEYTKLVSLVEIHNQGGTNTCVWQSIAQAVKVFLKARNAPKAAWLSVLFGYWNTLKEQGRGFSDNGCIPRIALQTLTDAGFCDEGDWPFIEAQVLNQPLPDVYTAAFDQKLITSYYRLFGVQNELIAGIKQALSQDRPVIWGSPIDDGYEKYSGGVMGPPTGPWLGSHMRCLVGYTADYAIEANSWDTNWGEGGLAKISWEFITWAYAHDFWVFDGVPVISG
jgi:hypothetical protein